jgi:hypothetical protein
MSRGPNTAGQAACEAYRRARGGKNHDGSDTPTWAELGAGVRLGWEAAAVASLAWTPPPLCATCGHVERLHGEGGCLHDPGGDAAPCGCEAYQ